MKIDKGVPIPKKKGRSLSEAAELMMSMQRGDSILLKKSLSSAVQFAVRYIGKGRYAVRTESGGIRVWRTK